MQLVGGYATFSSVWYFFDHIHLKSKLSSVLSSYFLASFSLNWPLDSKDQTHPPLPAYPNSMLPCTCSTIICEYVVTNVTASPLAYYSHFTRNTTLPTLFSELCYRPFILQSIFCISANSNSICRYREKYWWI